MHLHRKYVKSEKWHPLGGSKRSRGLLLAFNEMVTEDLRFSLRETKDSERVTSALTL